jgi:hypothetical protein
MFLDRRILLLMVARKAFYLQQLDQVAHVIEHSER